MNHFQYTLQCTALDYEFTFERFESLDLPSGEHMLFVIQYIIHGWSSSQRYVVMHLYGEQADVSVGGDQLTSSANAEISLKTCD